MVKRDFDAPALLVFLSCFFCVASVSPHVMLNYGLLVAMIFTPALAATLFTSEREGGRWETLRSTQLSSTEIVGGKLKLAVGNGLIHVYAFYLPALIILAMLFFTALMLSNNGVFRLTWDNIPRVWVGHVLTLVVLSLSVYALAAMSFWISTRERRAFQAIMKSYAAAAFLLFSPWFFQIFVPGYSTAAGSQNVNGIFRFFLAIWNAPVLFEYWPKAAMSGPSVEYDISQFWPLFAAHIAFLAALSLFFYESALRNINNSPLD
ncbi:MAG: hypothetical protein GC154_07130 [bacterium]|nr:hypothetical protein [bacterium]